MTGITRYKEAVQMIKTAILQSRYRAARAANAEQLKLYFNIGRYVSANTRTGKWGSGAIEEISNQLQAELPGLRGFSPSSIKYMRQFFEVWNEEFQADSNFAMKGSQLLADESLEADGDQSIRQLPIGELTAADMNAFGGIGFIRYFRSAGYNLLMNSSIFVRLQVLLRSRKDIANFNWDYIAYEKCNQNRHRHFNSTN